MSVPHAVTHEDLPPDEYYRVTNDELLDLENYIENSTLLHLPIMDFKQTNEIITLQTFLIMLNARGADPFIKTIFWAYKQGKPHLFYTQMTNHGLELYGFNGNGPVDTKSTNICEIQMVEEYFTVQDVIDVRVHCADYIGAALNHNYFMRLPEERQKALKYAAKKGRWFAETKKGDVVKMIHFWGNIGSNIKKTVIEKMRKPEPPPL